MDQDNKTLPESQRNSGGGREDAGLRKVHGIQARAVQETIARGLPSPSPHCSCHVLDKCPRHTAKVWACSNGSRNLPLSLFKDKGMQVTAGGINSGTTAVLYQKTKSFAYFNFIFSKWHITCNTFHIAQSIIPFQGAVIWEFGTTHPEERKWGPEVVWWWGSTEVS